MTFNELSLPLDLAANIPLAKHYEKLQYHQKRHHLNTMRTYIRLGEKSA